MNFEQIHDISPCLSDRIAVFPGDTPFRREVALSFARGDALALSSMHATLHAGAHVDAPCHYHPEGEDIARRSLRYYLGPCQVVTVSVPRGKRIYPVHVEQVGIRAPRILFRTRSCPDPNAWNDDFNALSPELVEFLANNGVCLVGIDTPSIDPAASKELESHSAIFAHDMAVLEGIVLDDVQDGLYTLIAPPLKIEGGDASPVRALLIGPCN